MASLTFKNVYLSDYYTIASKEENDGNIKSDKVINDFYFGCKTFEGAEIKMQKEVINNLLSNNKIDLIVGGDLSNQLAISAYMASSFEIPFLGVYSACATFNSALVTLSTMIDSNKISKGISVVSSHNKVSERQFRYPIEYGALKPKRSTYTATASVGVVVQKDKTNIKVESATIGKVNNSYIKDANNMGAVMAMSCAKTLNNHLKDLKRDINYYDIIITGDLGVYGLKIFKEYLLKTYDIKIKNYLDAGASIYKKEQELYAGASGPSALPLYLFSKILSNKKYKKILLLASGSLHSRVMVNQQNSIVSTCHALSLEVLS